MKEGTSRALEEQGMDFDGRRFSGPGTTNLPDDRSATSSPADKSAHRGRTLGQETPM